MLVVQKGDIGRKREGNKERREEERAENEVGRRKKMKRMEKGDINKESS